MHFKARSDSNTCQLYHAGLLAGTALCVDQSGSARRNARTNYQTYTSNPA